MMSNHLALCEIMCKHNKINELDLCVPHHCGCAHIEKNADQITDSVLHLYKCKERPPVVYFLKMAKIILFLFSTEFYRLIRKSAVNLWQN